MERLGGVASSHLAIVAVPKHQRALHGYPITEVQAGQKGFELHGHVAAREAVRREGVEGRHAAHRGGGCDAREIAKVGGAAAVLARKDGGDYL